MVKPVSIPAIETATEATWQEWCAFLDAADAKALDHNGIVKKARAFKPISGWWAQSVAVAYEQHIGRRQPGQTSDGLFSVSVSRTLPVSQKAAYKMWCDFASDLKKVDGDTIAAPPTTSTTPKRLYWRCKFDNGSAVSIGMEAKGPDKVLIGIEHAKLPHQSDLADKKRAWASLLDTCFK